MANISQLLVGSDKGAYELEWRKNSWNLLKRMPRLDRGESGGSMSGHLPLL